MRRPLAKLIARAAVIASMIASFAFPVHAQDGTGPMPENAQPRSHDGGWVRDLGCRVASTECLALDIPEHAYPIVRSYGPGWNCDRGYEPLGSACIAIDLPENAYLDRSGNRWSFNRGFLLSDGACTLGR